MKHVVNILMLSVLLVFLVSACQNKSENKNEETNSPTQQTEEMKSDEQAKAAEAAHPGKAVYDKYCLVCHQSDGSGVPGMHPPLGPGSWVGNPPEELIAMMMKGLSGKVEVNGEIYNGFMPSQAQLTDEEIADVLTYIRSSFGNNFDPVDAKLVKKVRSGR